MKKNKPLSEQLALIKSFEQKADWLKAIQYGEKTISKLFTFSYSPSELFWLYYKLGYAYFQLEKNSQSLNIYYQAYLIATKHSLKESVILVSRKMGFSFLGIKDIKSALAQFQKVEQYFQDNKDVFSPPLDKRFYIVTLIGLGYCHLHTNQLAEAQKVIDKISLNQSSIDKVSLSDYEHLKGEFFTSAKDYSQARQSFQECIKIGQEINFTIGILEAKIHLALLDIKEGNLDSSIQILKDILRESKHNKFNGLIGESGLLLAKCYSINGAPEKSRAIENKIRPILSKLDTVWLYEKTKEFGEVFSHLQVTLPGHKNDASPVSATLVKILNGRYESSSYKDIVLGQSDAMREVWHLMEKVAPTDLPILIQGETGTGKGLIARAIHQNSPRKDNYWMAFNSGALPETLIEDYLFGHIKGAYTGAGEDRKGYIELASGGTLFIDELAVMSLATQQKLLRVLEDGEIWRIGAQKPVTINTRFIFASNQDVTQMVNNKSFRQDLFYRINTINIYLPSLRERKEDIPMLLDHFIEKYHPTKMKDEKIKMIEISPETLGLLINYSWPGNVRELENEIRRIYTLYTDANIILPEMLSEPIRHHRPSVSHSARPQLEPSGIPEHRSASRQGLRGVRSPLKKMVNDYERNIIRESLREHNNNIVRTARYLGCTRDALYKKMRQLEI